MSNHFTTNYKTLYPILSNYNISPIYTVETVLSDSQKDHFGQIRHGVT